VAVTPHIGEPGGKRDAILDAALELFSERGFYGTAVPSVAELAHVGAGTVYRYFESKEALVNALYQREKQAFVAALMTDFPLEATTREQFREIWNRLWAFVQTHPKSAVFLELHHHAAYLDETSRALEERVMEPILAFVRSAQEKQALKALDPQLLVALVYGGFVHVGKAIWGGLLQVGPETLAQAEACLWEAVRL
jgi:TetR/AcrR family transcriptional regulator, repressor of fatR-cypB operon